MAKVITFRLLDAAALRVRRVMRRTAWIFEATGVELRYDHNRVVFIRVELDGSFRERDLPSVDWSTARRVENDMLVEMVLERYPERFVHRPANKPMRYRPLAHRMTEEEVACMIDERIVDNVKDTWT